MRSIRSGDIACAGWRVALIVLAAIPTLDACSGKPELVRGGAREVTLPSAGDLSGVPLGDFAGRAPNLVAASIRNPYEGSVAAREEGEQLFQQMNCAACHGYDAKGGMGPNLTDTYWRYGGSPAEIYKSIYDGRPKGMPAWGFQLPPDQIWKIVTYLGSLGGAFPARLADQGRQGNLGGRDSSALESMKGAQDDH